MNRSDKSTNIAIIAPANAHFNTGNAPTSLTIITINSSRENKESKL